LKSRKPRKHEGHDGADRDSGHDLRTPITALRLRAEFIEDEEIRNRIFETLDELQQMAEAALAFARAETANEETRYVDLSALVQTVCTDFIDMNKDVSFEEGGKLPVRCRPLGLKRAIRNLLENAVVHGKRARVSLTHKADEVAILIEDEGPGIPECEMQRVFVPFVRLDCSRGMNTGGIGLGLAIAQSIVRGHGGDIHLYNKTSGGLCAAIRLPNRS